jgi:hypothetical protein
VIKFAAKDILNRYTGNPFKRLKLKLIDLKYRVSKNFKNLRKRPEKRQ